MIKRVLIFTLVAALSFGIFSSYHTAASADSLDNGNVISDGIFDDSGSMSANDIDTWLDGFSGSCISQKNGFETPSVTGYSPSTSYTYGSLTSAGNVIATAAQVYGINPQVLLVRLESEEGLVEGDGTYGCSPLAMSAATGYDCAEGNSLTSYTVDSKNGAPTDMGGGSYGTTSVQTCVSSEHAVGFSAQVILAAWQLAFDQHRSEGQNNWYVDIPGWNNSDDLNWCYTTNRPDVHIPNTNGRKIYLCPNNQGVYAAYGGQYTIDGQTVTIQNGATAAMYNYTPHIQTRFYNYFTGWFGSTQANGEILRNSLGSNQLSPGTTMNAGDFIVSPDGEFVMTLQYDGNLVTYAGNQAVWASGTYGNSGDYAVFQNDGNFVIYNADGSAIWSSGTDVDSANGLTLGDDGNVVISKDGTAKWNTDIQARFGTDLGTSIASQTFIRGGDYLLSPNGQFVTVMQGDGNLVTYTIGGGVLWSSGTANNPGAYAVMQYDGNFVIYSASGHALWSSGTAGKGASTIYMQSDGNFVAYKNSGGGATWANSAWDPGAQVDNYISDHVSSQTRLNATDYLRSTDWRYTLVMQTDGNLVLFSANKHTQLWSTHTEGNPGAYAVMQYDGNFVIYSASGHALWSSGTAGKGASTIYMQSDSNLVIYKNSGGSATWASNTSGGGF